MFGFVFKSKVLGVLEHDFGWKLSTQSLGSIYKVPLDDISKSVKKRGGNEYDAAFSFLFCAADNAFPTDISDVELKNLVMMNYMKHSSKTVFPEVHEESFSGFMKEHISEE